MSHPLTSYEKVKKARAEAERWSVDGAELSSAQAARLSQCRKTNPLTVEQKAERAMADTIRYRHYRLTVEQKA